jgi:hypothetical protein
MKTSLFNISTLAAVVSAFGLVACVEEDSPSDEAPEVHHFRVTAIDLPEASDEVGAMAFDLDGDSRWDNTLGTAYWLLQQVYTSFDVEAIAAERLGSDLGWVLTIVDRPDGVSAGLSLGTFAGNAVLAPALDSIEPADGAAFGRGFVLRGGTADLPMGTLSDAAGASDPAWLASEQLALSIDAWDAATATATVGVALRADDVRAIVYPNLATYFTSKLSDPTANFAHMLDADDSGVITPEEIAANTWIDGYFQADLDGAALSLGLRLRAEALQP